MRLASSISNYILYMKDHFPDKFSSIIWPAISGMSYEKAEQEGKFNDLASTVGTVNSEGTGYSQEDTTEIDTANDEQTTYDVDEPEDYDDWYMVDDSEGE